MSKKEDVLFGEHAITPEQWAEASAMAEKRMADEIEMGAAFVRLVNSQHPNSKGIWLEFRNRPLSDLDKVIKQYPTDAKIRTKRVATSKKDKTVKQIAATRIHGALL